MSTPTIKLRRFPCKVLEIFVPFWPNLEFPPTDLRASSQYKISRKPVQCEPRWCMRTDGQTDRRRNGHNEASWRLNL